MLKILMLCLVVAAASGTCEKCGKAVDEAVGGAKTKVVELQTAVAPTPTSPANSRPPKATISLRIEQPAIREKQDLHDRNQLWQGLASVMAEEANQFGQRFGTDCYFSTASATYDAAQHKWISAALNKLAAGIATAPLGAISTGSIGGDALLKVGSYIIQLSLSDDPARTTLEFVAEQTAGFILGRAVDDLFLEITSGAVGEALVQKALSKDSVISDTAHSDGSRFRAATPTSVDVRLFYNPYTRYVVAGLRPACGTMYLVRYEVSSDGLMIGSPSILSVDH